MKKMEILQKLPRIWQRDMKWANAIGKLVPIDLLNAGLPKTWICKNTQSLQSTIKQGLPSFQMIKNSNWNTDTWVFTAAVIHSIQGWKQLKMSISGQRSKQPHRMDYWGLPWWLSSKDSAFSEWRRCRRRGLAGFDPWVCNGIFSSVSSVTQ